MKHDASPTVESIMDLTSYFPGESGGTLYPGLTMESSKYVLILRNEKVNVIDTETKQLAAMGVGAQAENLSAIVTPTDNIVALRTVRDGGTEIQVFDCNKKEKIYRVHIPSAINFWKWISNEMLAISVQKQQSSVIIHLNIRTHLQTEIVSIRSELSQYVVWNYAFDQQKNKTFVMGLCRCSDGVRGIIQVSQLSEPRKEILIEAFVAANVTSPCANHNLLVYAEKSKLCIHREGMLIEAPITLSDQLTDFPFLLVVHPHHRQSMLVLTKGGVLNIYHLELTGNSGTLTSTNVSNICSGTSVVRAVPTIGMGSELSLHVVLSSCVLLRVRCSISGSAVEDPWATFTGQPVEIKQQPHVDMFNEIKQKPAVVNNQLFQRPPEPQLPPQQPFHVPGPPIPELHNVPHQLPANTARYSVKKKLGSGGQGDVFLVDLRVSKGRRQPTDAVITCALKRIRCESLQAGNTALEEVKALQALDHPNVLKIIDFFLEEVNCSLIVCIACEYCSLGDVHRYADRIGGFKSGSNWPLLLRWTREIASALDYLHSNRLIHRDLKPGNLFLAHDQAIKLGDFGLARADDDLAQTQCGTPMFLSPEVLQQKPYGNAVDMYVFNFIFF